MVKIPPVRKIRILILMSLTRHGYRQRKNFRFSRDGYYKGGGGNVAKKTEIKKDLNDQLDRKGVYGKHYRDLIDDYMALWTIKNKLIADIRKRGVSVEYNNGGGQIGYKKNESIAELNKTNAQMLKILSELGLKASSSGAGDDPDEEM